MANCFNLNSNTNIIFNGSDNEPISNAVAVLKRDIEKTLIAGQAPKNRILAAEPDPSLPPESWILTITPEEITVRCGCSLGCVYALLYISEKYLGITPFWYWNDQQFEKNTEIKIPAGQQHSPKFAVRYRGWFVNDEVLIDNWLDDENNDEHWRMVFEALLRCGGNLTIPGTDHNSIKNRKLAADMGLFITYHHAEPLGAQMFSRVYPDKTPSYIVNSSLFEELWEKAVIEQKDYKIIWALGFRGQGDRPFWDDDPLYATAEQRGKLIGSIISKQMEIIKRHVQNPVFCINLYGEFVELYRSSNLEIQPGIIKIWADNGYGRMVSRRQGNHNPRLHALPTAGDGSHGIYYHCSFHDLQASNHLTMSPNSMEFLKAELKKSLDAGAGECWIINCGSVKPHVHSLDLLREMWQAGDVNVNEWRRFYAKLYYDEKEEEIAELLGEYASCTAKYGINEDERAGEQIWHHPVRELLSAWISGKTDRCLESLLWLTGDIPFAEQVKTLLKLSEQTIPGWEAFLKKCDTLLCTLNKESQKLFMDSLLLQARLQYHGAAGTKAFCESFLSYASGDIVRAFIHANRSHSNYKRSFEILLNSEHDKWKNFYRGDCLTDVNLTASCLEGLVQYLRIQGDGPDFHKWEKDFITPESERKVKLLSSKKRALSNEELSLQLEQVFGL